MRTPVNTASNSLYAQQSADWFATKSAEFARTLGLAWGSKYTPTKKMIKSYTQDDVESAVAEAVRRLKGPGEVVPSAMGDMSKAPDNGSNRPRRGGQNPSLAPSIAAATPGDDEQTPVTKPGRRPLALMEDGEPIPPAQLDANGDEPQTMLNITEHGLTLVGHNHRAAGSLVMMLFQFTLHIKKYK